MEKDYKLLMKTAILAGEILLSSGAETYRVEDTMKHILNKSGFEVIETYALLTGIMATLDDESIETITYVKQVPDVGMNLTNIIVVTDIAYQLCGDEISLKEAHRQLKSYKFEKYHPVQYALGAMGIVVGFSIFLGGTILDVCVAFCVAIVLAFLMSIGNRIKFNGAIYNIVNGAGIALTTLIAQTFLPNVNIENVIISSIMPLVPGVALTIGIRDVLEGDYVSGNARILKALLTAAGIALGIGIGMLVFPEIGI